MHKLGDSDYCLVPIEFLERLNSQNKVIWKNQLKQQKKLDEIDQMLKKIHREDALTPIFFEVNIFQRFVRLQYDIPKAVFPKGQFPENFGRNYHNL